MSGCMAYMGLRCCSTCGLDSWVINKNCLQACGYPADSLLKWLIALGLLVVLQILRFNLPASSTGWSARFINRYCSQACGYPADSLLKWLIALTLRAVLATRQTCLNDAVLAGVTSGSPG
jgi:ribosomal protein L37E